MLGVQLRAESRFEKKILVLNDGSWLHDDFPDFETKDNTKTCKKSLGFSSLFHRENRITSGTTKKAAVAVGRKLAVIMHRMMLEEKDFIYGEPKVA